MTTLIAKFYNIQVSRDNGVVAKEIRALLGSGPHVLGLCEATGYNLPGVDGYKLIRDTSTKSRANIAAYVRTDTKTSEKKWHDLKETWTRTQHPGTHEPRSWLEFRLEGCQVIVGHQPPKGTDNVKQSQQEGIDLLTGRMAPWLRDDWDDKPQDEKDDAKACPRISLADFNRRSDETGPGPAQLASNVDGHCMGAQIDLAVCRGKDCQTKDVCYVTAPQGVKLKGDHDDALVVKLTVKDRWL
jgi:hypothetical protein